MPADTTATPQTAGAPARGSEKPAGGGSRLRALLGRWETLLLGLLVLTAIFGQGLSSEFLTSDSFTTGSLDLSEVALMALALTLVIVAAEIDLSVASVLALSSALMAELWNAGLPLELIMPICLGAGALCGAFNGILVTRLGLPSLAVTIGTFALFRGLAFVVIGDESVTDSSPMTTKASPRNRASVPIVTASEGSPSRVTSTPLKAPHSAPAARQMGMISSSGRPEFQSSAISALESARTEATERSISAATMTSVSARPSARPRTGPASRS